MANRYYLYSLSNRPTDYTDRPVSISGLSVWRYDVPFAYRLLMSGDPQLCPSLMTPGLEEEDDPDHLTPIYAISSEFEFGFQRLTRFLGIVRHLVQAPAAAMPRILVQAPAVSRGGLLGWLFRRPRPAQIVRDSVPLMEGLLRGLDETERFLRQHSDRYLLLETSEIDLMSEGESSALVAAEIARCLKAGQALDALPDDLDQAAACLREATTQRLPAPLDAFYGLRLDDDCDNGDKTEHLLGLQWPGARYFELANQAQFQAES